MNLSYTFPILETSATALCGTTGIWKFIVLDQPKFPVNQAQGVGHWLKLDPTKECVGACDFGRQVHVHTATHPP